jgi:ABC-type amino acid transport system permease subunit
MGHAKILSARYFIPIPTYIAVAVIYLILVGLASLLLRYVGKKLETPGLEMDAATR